MIRLDEKQALLRQCCSMYSELSRYSGCLPKKLKKITDKSIQKDVLIGLKQINKKCPIYVELPKLKNVGNGMYSEEYKDKPPDGPKEIITTPVVIVSQEVKKNE